MRALLLSMLVLAGAVHAQEPRLYSPDEMQADVLALVESYQSLHAGLARYTSAEEFDGAVEELLQAVQEGPRDLLWFQRRLSELIAVVRCGHTRLLLGDPARAALLEARGLVPLELVLEGERAWVRRVLVEGTGIAPGAELLELDGLPFAELRRRAFTRLSDDGFVETGKQRVLEESFAESYALLVDERAGGRTGHELRLAGAGKPVRLADLAPAEFARRRTPPRARELVEFRLLPEDDAAYLYVREFGDDAGPTLPERLEASFRALKEAGVGSLVLDLRGNGGGRDMYGALLCSYLADRPFGYFERIEVTPDYRPLAISEEDQVEIEERDGRRLMLSHRGLQVQAPAEARFAGRAYLLVDGLTFSTAADVASVVRANHLAVLVGEESGGGYEGNTSGDSTRVALPSSHLAASLPQWTYFTAGVGGEHHGRGALPDHAVRPTIADVLSGRDAELEFTLALIRAARAPR